MTSKEHVQDVDYCDVMSSSYVDYAMSTIVDRAIPDVRDGLKPVQRRVLYDMYDLGATHDKPYKKTARIVGDTIGRFHPHGSCLRGDTKVYCLDNTVSTIQDIYNSGRSCQVLSLSGDCKVIPAEAMYFRKGLLTDEEVKITFTNGYSIYTTKNHRFMDVLGNWYSAKDIKYGMILDTCVIDEVPKGSRPRLYHNYTDLGLLYRYVYTCKYGNIPRGYNIHHIDKNKYNNIPSNLECLSDREHALRHKYEGLEGLNKGRVSMDEDSFFSARRHVRNSQMMRHYNDTLFIRKAVKALDILTDRGIDLTIDNYNSLRQDIYNLTKIDTLIRRGIISDFEDFVCKYLTGYEFIEPLNKINYGDLERCNNTSRRPSSYNWRSHIIIGRLCTYYKNNGFVDVYNEQWVRNTLDISSVLNHNGTYEEWLQYVSSNLGIIANVEIRKLDKPIQYYDFTVPHYENMFIPVSDSHKLCVLTHNSGVEVAIETMTQEFKKPVPLVDGQGNWGSVEGDGAAASRYTECRLTEFSEQVLLNLLNSNTVDFQPNYDNTLEEPVVLPAVVPSVLVTGNEGIAVGMRTSIPTFNLSEVVDANEYVLTHQNVSVDKLLEIMPGPDFVSGGVVCNASDMKSLYETGQGSLRVRGKVTFWKGKSKEKDKLVVEEIPYSMIGTSLISFMQDVVGLVESGELPGVVDVVNKSGKSARVELVLSRNADIEQIKNTLFVKTKLESVVPVNLLVIDNGTPCTMNMTDLLSSYCEFQKQTYKRKFQFDLNKLTERRDVLLAYVTCCKNIQEVVNIAQNSKSVQEAKTKLAEKYNFSDSQSSAVLSLRIQRLVGMEVDKVQSELSDVESRMQKCESVLQSDKKLVRAIVSDIRRVKSKFGYSRRTKLTDVEVASCVEKEKKEVPLVLLCDRFSYAHCVDEQTYDRNRDTVQREFPTVCRTSSLSKVYVFDSQGNLNRVRVSDVPTGQLRAKGTPLDVITCNKFDSKSSSVVLAVDEGYVQSVLVSDVLVVTRGGMCKRVAKDQLVSTRKCSQYVVLSDNDEVVYVGVCHFKSFEVTTSDGRTKVVKTSDVPVKSRGSKGVRIVSFKSLSTTITNVVTSK